MRVLICGSREWDDAYAVNCVLNGYRADGDPVTVISGMARGADSCGFHWARENGEDVAEYPADWDRHGNAAGPIRNQQMLDEGKPEVVWAFKSRATSLGTDDMVRRAKKAGVLVYVVMKP